jgi:hypothetical protein
MQVDKLKGVYELVVNKQPSLLEEFLPEVAELRVDPSPHVRKYLPEFLTGAAQVGEGQRLGGCSRSIGWRQGAKVAGCFLIT